jgi:DNA-binding response OmpR family regulator
MTIRVLIVERGQQQRSSFADALRKRYDVEVTSSGKQAIEVAKRLSPVVIILDAISMRTSGERICDQLKQTLASIPLIHLHPGSKGEAKSCADFMLLQPFTVRKLINLIERFTPQVAVPRDERAVECGPFQLFMERRVLLYNGVETNLTPKLAQLISVFLQSPGQTLDRKTLMERVWETAYIGDTNTLNVHIRWFRQAIEVDPGKPVFLKTVRGIGYRLDVRAMVETIDTREMLLEPV